MAHHPSHLHGRHATVFLSGSGLAEEFLVLLLSLDECFFEQIGIYTQS